MQTKRHQLDGFLLGSAFWVEERGKEGCVLEAVERELLARPLVADHLLALRRDMDDLARLRDALSSGG